jgi:hypothetical protein
VSDRPSHYQAASVECIDCIRVQMTPEELAGFYRGNILKYLWRYKDKGGVEDLKKARVYLDWMISDMEAGDE